MFALLARFGMSAELDASYDIRNDYHQLRKCISKHISKADSKQNAFTYRHCVSLRQKIIIVIGCEIVLSAGSTAKRLTITDFLKIVQTAGDTLITVGIECVKGD